MTAITGRSAFLRLLVEEGVDTLFGNPGTTELAIMEALGSHPELRADTLLPCDVVDAVLAQATDAAKPFFRVPRVIER